MASFFRGIMENWKLKTLALAMAGLLWAVWSADAITSNWIPVPVQVVVGDSRYRSTGTVTHEVEVRFSGTGRDLLEIAVTRPPLVLTIDEATGETADYTLDPRMVRLPAPLAVSALEVRPRVLPVSLERIESRTVPVRPRIVDSL
jgi:YbbR domain-containing protein